MNAKFDNKIPSQKANSRTFKPKQDEISFDAKSAKVYIGQKMYLTLEKFFRDDFEKFFKDLSASQKIVVMQLFFNTYFPKEIKVDNTDPFDDWTTEELKTFRDTGEKPKGKIIYTVK